MAYSQQTDDDSSDIELVQPAAPVASTSAARGAASPSRPSVNSDKNSYSAHDDLNSVYDNQNYADFFAEANNAASNLSLVAATYVRDLSPPPRRASGKTATASKQPVSRMQTDRSDVIKIDSDDDDDDDSGVNARPSSSAAGYKASTSMQSGQADPRILRKAHSAPTAVFESNKSKGKQRLFEPMDSDEDDLPDLGNTAGRGSALKRSSSETATSTSTKRRFKYTDSTSVTAKHDNNASLGRLSPIPASSPPPAPLADSSYWSRDRKRPNEQSHLPSDVTDTSADEGDRPPRKKKQAKPKAQETSPEPGPSKPKPPTKKQLAEQERAAKKAQKEKEKAEKAELTAIEKERKNGLKVANKLEDRQQHCKEVYVQMTTSLLEDDLFRNKVYVDVAARLEQLSCQHTQPGEGLVPKAGCFDKLILWRRKVTKDYASDRRYWVPRSPDKVTYEQEKNVLMFMTGQEVEKAVAAHKFPQDEDRGETLLEMVANVKKAYGSDYKVIILVQNLSQKMKAKRLAENAEFQAEVRNNGAPTKARRKKAAAWDDRIAMEDIELEFVRLQIVARCSIQKNEKPEDAIDWIVEFTKDIAHRPYKMIERVREMYLNIDGKIESSDRGDLHKTYVNQLACINGVTEPLARAIAARFPTWRRLRQAFAEAPDPAQTLAGISILNRVDGAATNRMTGRAISERIHIFLTSRDPNLLFTGDIKAVRARV